ncbi:chemotaxis-specific protein-glutamate methyltransferase CheB [Marinobacter halodurans]|uniref:Protein-glutamate methylesterase/protein-glutamine glutaminase n=1 Tax=Marinobacter halodurans TaxID=2528979 RepID=A0ABY1ZRE6_9GAMM|nr:chemotaxis-specific protein-glutamate methyltransferase CheB [Marinobacter halodurans]TBW57653.1 chemotaxis-specific protein-glutamate methyltransferase CheB [Marinobacter halodurans]
MDVLIVEDSVVVRQLIRHILEEADCRVIGEVSNGEEAVAFVARQRPDVIAMDIHMPGMNGYQASRRIMETRPVPIVVVTSSENLADGTTAMRVLEAGAITVVQKPQGPGHPDFEQHARELVRTLRIASEVKLVRRIPRRDAVPEDTSLNDRLTPKVIAIGASTGGPQAIKALLGQLRADLPWPVLIVQHIAPGFLPSLREWLNETCALNVRIAEQGESPQAGQVYLAPDGAHMTLDARQRIALVNCNGDGYLCPSVARLFDSLARHVGGRVVAVLLSGMGSDGAAEMRTLRQLGALTVAQDPTTVVVNGMPGEAVRLEAAEQVLTPSQIAEWVAGLYRTHGEKSL